MFWQVLRYTAGRRGDHYPVEAVVHVTHTAAHHVRHQPGDEPGLLGGGVDVVV